MNFLTPSAIAIAAALTVPPLVLLYFLKLRRQEVPISSTFFWKRAIQDLQVNAPFQKLRKNLLMLLQLLVLLLAAFALGQPLMRSEETHRKSLILLIDRSCSMNVVEPDGHTRLERAKTQALKMVDSIGVEFDRAMVIAFSDRAKMMAAFTNDRGKLERAITSIDPSDGLSRLSEAIALAEAHSQTQIVEAEGITATPVPTGPPARAILFSDGRIEDGEVISLERIHLKMVNVAVQDDNVGITSLSASRYYERPEVLSVVASVQNFGSSPVEIDVELLIEGEHKDIQSLTLGPGIEPGDKQEFDPQKATQIVAFDEIEFASSGVIEVRLSRLDHLAADNRAYAVIGEPRHVKVLLVTQGNFALAKALDPETVALSRMTPSEYEAAPDDDIADGRRAKFDVVIFDGCTTARLPTGNYIFFGTVPAIEGFSQGEVVEFDPVWDWDESHPIMRYVQPHDIVIFQYRKPLLPVGAEPLIDAEQGPVVSVINHQGNRYLLCAFGIMDDSRESFNTTWPFRVSFVVFMKNAVQFLSGSLDMQIQAKTRPGDSLTVETSGRVSKVTIERPDDTTDSITMGSHQTAHYGKTDRVGVYTASPTIHGSTSYAVNLFSVSESRIQPNADFAIGGEVVQSGTSVQLTNVPLWPWFLLAALAFLFLEWAVYSRRILV